MNHVIILAGGQGQRMSLRKDKLLVLAAGKPVIYYSIMAFNENPSISTISIVVNHNNKEKIEQIVGQYRFNKVKNIINGGITRQKSLEKAIALLDHSIKSEDILLVHNGANPLPSQREINEIIAKSQEHGAAIVVKKITSTIKELEGEHILKTHDRKKIFTAETPQAAQFSIMKKAVKNAQEKQLEATDESMMLEAISQPVVHVEADEENFKITHAGDYHKLRTILGEISNDFRIGIGQDSHPFDKKHKGLTLGGMYFPELQKTEANSDGDVILHSIFNAISQSIGEKSLGFYADSMCEKGITDSKEYLKVILDKIKDQGFEINTIGVMLECKSPKIDPISEKLKESLSKIFKISANRIGITATSGENMTVFGTGLAIQAFSIVSLKKEES